MKLTKAFFDDIRKLIVSARTTVARGVDLVQVHTNFEIGRRIVEQELHGEDRAIYGKEVMKALAEQLTREFGKGFSHTNLKLMRLFYLQNQGRIGQSVTDQLGSGKKLQSMPGKSVTPQPRPFALSWTHYAFLLGVKNSDERSFYEIESAAQGWTVRELKRQFDSGLYERLALSHDKAGIRKLAQKGQIVEKVPVGANDYLPQRGRLVRANNHSHLHVVAGEL